MMFDQVNTGKADSGRPGLGEDLHQDSNLGNAHWLPEALATGYERSADFHKISVNNNKLAASDQVPEVILIDSKASSPEGVQTDEKPFEPIGGTSFSAPRLPEKPLPLPDNWVPLDSLKGKIL
jgi:hypothetical protein